MVNTLMKNELENSSIHSNTLAHYDACYGGDDITGKTHPYNAVVEKIDTKGKKHGR